MTRDKPLLDLHTLVMRKALQVALLAIGAAVVIAVVRANRDIDEEQRAAYGLAQVMGQLAALADVGDEQAAGMLQAVLGAARLRHLELVVHDAAGRVRAATPQAAQPPPATAVRWRVDRGVLPAWSVSLAPSRVSERREAWADAASLLGVLMLGGAAMLGVMGWNVRRALAPLAAMRAVIGRVERGEPQAVDDLPPMSSHELQAIAAALRRLGAAVQAEQAQRRMLGRQMLTLQEDERARLAAELHDEFGQRLTALRVDAAWLQRRLAGQNDLLQVVQGMVTHCEAIQADIRGVLARLQPLAPRGVGGATPAGGEAASAEPLERLRSMLQALVDGWQREGGPVLSLHVDIDAAAPAALPQAVALALYRISQEALTNVARHARATRAELSLRVAAGPPGAGTIEWQACDNGVGIAEPGAALQRGNGLAGIKQRVWALGGDLAIGAAPAGSPSPGLLLRTTIALDAPADGAAAQARLGSEEHRA